VAGPLLAAACFLLLPETYATGPSTQAEFTVAGRATLAMVAWMATWWMTEAVDIEVTALLPIAIFPLLGIASIANATEPYASDVIYLFMGGFILGLAIERWGWTAGSPSSPCGSRARALARWSRASWSPRRS